MSLPGRLIVKQMIAVSLLFGVLLIAGCVEDPADWKSRGDQLLSTDHFEDAVLAYDRALEIDPADPVVWNNRGVALARLERYEEAVESYDHALALDPGYAIAETNRAKAVARLSRMEAS